MTRRTLLLALPLAALLVPSHASAGKFGPWTTPQDAGPGGAPTYGFGVPAIASAPRDGVAVLLRREDRAARTSIVTLRRTRRGRLGRPLLLARVRGADDLALDVRPGGDAVAAWRAYVPGVTARGGNHRIFSARTTRRARSSEVRVDALTGGGSSAYSPTFVVGLGGPVLVWARREGPLGVARWSGPQAPSTGQLGLPASGLERVRGAGNRNGITLAALLGSSSLRLVRSRDAGRTFADPVSVPGSTQPLFRAPVAVAVSNAGTGVAAWVQRGGAGTEISVSVLRRGTDVPTGARVIAASQTGTSAAVVSLPETGAERTLVGWVETDASSRTARRPGRLRLRLVGRDGVPVGDARTLGDRGERGADLELVTRGGRGATALWRTASGRLRAQDVDATGNPGRAVTLDRGVAPFSVRTAGRGGVAATWVSRGRVRLAFRPAGQ